MAGLFKRTLVAAAGVLIGMAAVSAFGPMRHPPAQDTAPPALRHVHGERAPDDRV